ncbi:MAG: tetratricopeptide repeat protein [Verrucomicrobiota bacterium]|nr:tetratricopeptide repeat protein [Verrucomicrobiota bacterium]
MEQYTDKIERSLLKVFLFIAGIVLVLAVAGYGSLRVFHGYQERRLLTQAHTFVGQHDYKRASLNAQRALQINPNNAEANRVLGTIAERTNLRTAVDFRKRVVELVGRRADDLTAWARTAIRFGDAKSGREAVNLVAPKDRNNAEYHALVADISLLEHDAASYQKEMEEANRLDPANKTYAFVLASIQSALKDPAVRAGGVQVLEQLQNDPQVGQEAQRRLAQISFQKNDFPSALKYARALDSRPDHTFSDRLLLLSALRATNDASWNEMLATLQKEARSDPNNVGSLLQWMNAQGLAVEGAAYIKTLAKDLLGQKLLPLTLADTLVVAKDWKGLEDLLKGATWGPLDFMRNALLARSYRETGNVAESKQQWSDAVHKVSNSSAEQVILLSSLALKWGWEAESLDLLWVATKDPKLADKTLETLYRYYADRGETQEVYRVMIHVMERHPDDAPAMNNMAQLGLLLGLDLDRAHKLAYEVHQRDPKSAIYASTYGYSLYMKGELKQALQAFAEVPKSELRQPAVALYYGLILSANGDLKNGREFLDLAEQARLLPEEKALLAKGKQLTAGTG